MRVSNPGSRSGHHLGLCHFTTAGNRDGHHSILARFDCDLSPEYDNPEMREMEHYWTPDVYFRSGLSADSRAKQEQLAINDLAED